MPQPSGDCGFFIGWRDWSGSGHPSGINCGSRGADLASAAFFVYGEVTHVPFRRRTFLDEQGTQRGTAPAKRTGSPRPSSPGKKRALGTTAGELDGDSADPAGSEIEGGKRCLKTRFGLWAKENAPTRVKSACRPGVWPSKDAITGVFLSFNVLSSNHLPLIAETAGRRGIRVSIKSIGKNLKIL